MPTKALLVKSADDDAEGKATQPAVAPVVAMAAAAGQQAMSQPRESRVRLKWDDRLQQLKTFKAKHSHVDVPRSYAKDPSLGTFVCNQRQTYKRMNEGKGPSMDRVRISQLNELGFKWVLKHRDQPTLDDDDDNDSEGGQKPAAKGAKAKQLDWHSGIEQLNAFKLENGHLDVPHIYAANQQLGNFVKTIRQTYKNLQKGKANDKFASQLTQPRIHELQRMGFKLQVRHREPWEQRFSELRQYIHTHGNCDVPKNTPLGIWILNQRSQFKLLLKKKPSHMSVERINLLNSLGFDWRVPGMQQAAGVCVSVPAYVPTVATSASMPSDAALASALVSENPATVNSSSNVAALPVKTEEASLEELPVEPSDSYEIFESKNLSGVQSFEANTGMLPNQDYSAASNTTNQGDGYGIQPQLLAAQLEHTAHSLTDDSTMLEDRKPSAIELSMGPSQPFMSELHVQPYQPYVLSDFMAGPLPNHRAPMLTSFMMHPSHQDPSSSLAATHVRDEAPSTSNISNNFEAYQHLGKPPAPSSVAHFTSDMFVESLLQSPGFGVDMNPFVTEESSSDDEIIQI